MDVNFKFNFVTDECLSLQIIYIITDHGRNMLIDIRNPNMVGLFCITHTSQLVFFDARKEMINFTETLKETRKIVGCYKQC